MTSYDVAIVGGGHNALVCAGYLAGAGLKVVVLERRHVLGGPAAKVEFLPGYSFTFSNSPGSFEPKIARDLELERHGLRFRTQDPTLVHPLEDGPGPDLCESCHEPLDHEWPNLFRMQNVATRRRDRINSDEEERFRLGYELRTGVRLPQS